MPISKLLRHALCFLISTLSVVPAFSESKSGPKSGEKQQQKLVTKSKQEDLLKRRDLLLKKIEANPQDKPSRKDLAKIYLRSGQYKEAIEQLQQALSLEDRDSYMLLAAAYRFSKNYLDEIRMLNLLTPQYPNYPKLYVLLAKAYFKIENYDESIAKFKKALSIQPKYEEAQWGVYTVYQVKKNNYESRLILEDMVRLFGEKPKIYSELCRLYSEDSFFEKSLESCQIAVQLDPKLADNHIYLGLTYKLKEDLVQAEKILTTAAKHFSKSSFAQEAAGSLLVERENYELGARYLQKCSELDKENLKCWRSLAKAQFQLAKYKEALNAYLNTCRLDRSSVPEFKKQASILRANGKSDWYDNFTQGIMKCYY